MFITSLSGIFLRRIIWSIASLAFFLVFLLVAAFFYLETQLPDVETLKTVKLQEPLRIYSQDRLLMAEFGRKRRIPVTLDQMPKLLIQAVLATEDQRFFEHAGVDFVGLMRAMTHLLRTGRKDQGASTITMQVARNFFLTRKKTYIRKIKEILLAIKIDRELSKEKVLELYLNKIYFGKGAYGVAAASEVYYGKSLDMLTLPEMAMLAGLPQAPSKINPIRNPDLALKRRNHVLNRMYEEGLLTQSLYTQAMAQPIHATYHRRLIELDAPHVAEHIRQLLYERYGDALYDMGLRVYTTLDSRLQRSATRAVIRALIRYDKRHGYRGPAGFITETAKAMVQLEKLPTLQQLQPAWVLEVKDDHIMAQLKDEQIITVPWSTMQWAQKETAEEQEPSAKPASPHEVVQVNEVIYVYYENQQWQFAQIPLIEGALVALDPNNGKILAMVGGFDFKKSHYNRSTQAYRQPGSCFKPFIYAAALEKGYTLASIINDAPLVVDDPSQDNYLWRPHNDNRHFYGPTRLRDALIRSRNLVSIRLLSAIGLDYTIDYIERFGFEKERMPYALSLALGSAEVTPLQLATGFAVFANGGYKIESYMVNKIVNAQGEVLFTARLPVVCQDNQDNKDVSPEVQLCAPSIISPQIAYLINLALKDSIYLGTARRATMLQRSDLAGKTGTTNDKVDAWFAGFNTQIVATTWVGFDQPTPIAEYGSQVALPMWIDFMREALQTIPESHLPEPANMVTVRIDPHTGLLARADHLHSMFETFRVTHVPTQYVDKLPDNEHSNLAEQENIEYLF